MEKRLGEKNAHADVWFVRVRFMAVFYAHTLLLSVHTRSLGSAITLHRFSYHCYADNTQLFLSFPPPSDTNVVSRNVWQTSPLCITSSLTFIKLNSSSFRGKTALAWTCQPLSRTSQYRLHWLWATWAQSSTPDYPASPTSLLWPEPEDLPSVNICRIWCYLKGCNAIPGPSASLDYCNLLLAGLPASVTKYPEFCSLPCFQSIQILPCDPPTLWPPLASFCGPHLIQDNGAGLQGHQLNCKDLQTLVRPNTPVRALRSTTATGQVVPKSLRANKVAQPSHSSSLLWCLSGGANSWLE